jgi:hypothetical protein
MNTAEIHHALRSNPITRTWFRGVFAADEIPGVMQLPAAYVVNTDTASEPGTHWIAFCHHSPHTLEYFDSFGRQLSSYGIHVAPRVVQQSLQLQSDFSTVCGQYCMFFLLRRMSGESYEHIVHLFTENRESNDQMVCQYVNFYFDLQTKVYDTGMLKQVAKQLIKI